MSARGKGPRVKLLSAHWCQACKQVRAWLQEQGIAFEDLDVERSARGRAEFRRVGGKGVPIMLVGEEVIRGFSPARFLRHYGRAGKRR